MNGGSTAPDSGADRFGPARRRAGVTRVLLVTIALVAGVLVTTVAGSATTPVSVAGTCAVSGPATESGSVLISSPMLPQITGSDLLVAPEVDTTVPDAINPGQVLSNTATLKIDLDAIAQDVLENRVKPGVAAAGYPALASTAWVELDLRSISFSIPFPPGTAPSGTPTAVSSTSAASAAWSTDAVTVTVDQLRADSRSPEPASTTMLSWSLLDGGSPAPRTLDFEPGALSFEAEVTVGVLFYGVPLTGAVTAPWACTPDELVPVLASTAVVAGPVSTTLTTLTSTTPTSATTSTTSTSTTSTTWPSDLTVDPAQCQVSGFDNYGGYTGITLEATGFFRTARIGGRWWFIDPDGHPFFSQGINNTTFMGTPDKYGATPYNDAVVAKYGTAENWAAAQVDRMDAWGYNTLGAWSDTDLFAGTKPYTVLLNMTGQNFATGEMEDLFDPGWEARVRVTAANAAVRGDDPYLVGYWSDNELHFGPDWRPLHLFDSYLARDATAPGKAALITFLQDRYPTFERFAADFTTTATDWAELRASSTVTEWTGDGGESSRAAWVGKVAERYFSVTAGAVRDADPDHLFLGPRLIAQTTGTPVLEAAARYVDVASFNLYPLRPELLEPLRNADPTYLPVDGGLAAQAAVLDKPILITEWSYRAADSGLPNTWPPLFPVLETQEQRAAAYERYVMDLLDTNWIVGQHWFEHADEPPAGRFDGEDSNFGLVDNNDNPYELLVEVSRTMHDCAYSRLLTDPTATTTTTTTAPAPTSAPSTTTVVTTPTTPPPATPAAAIEATPNFTG